MGDAVASEVKRFQRKAASTDTIPFYLGDELFHAVATLPGGRILDFAALTSLTEDQQAELTQEQQDEAGRESLAAVTALFETSIVPNDQARWKTATRDIGKDGSVVGLGELMEIGGWLIGEYAANPTGVSSASASTPGKPSVGSSDGASSGVTTYSRPPRPKRSR